MSNMCIKTVLRNLRRNGKENILKTLKTEPDYNRIMLKKGKFLLCRLKKYYAIIHSITKSRLSRIFFSIPFLQIILDYEISVTFPLNMTLRKDF